MSTKQRYPLATQVRYGRVQQIRRLIVAASLISLTVFIAYRAARAQETIDTYKFGRDAQQGQKVNPVPLNLQGKEPELVYLGSYLVNVQLSCNDCHTCPSFKSVDPYSSGGSGLGTAPDPGPINTVNYLAGGTPVAGHGKSKSSTFTSPNLTPDASGLPGGLTFAEFKDAMQHGQVQRKPGHILQVMPWPLFRNLYDNDLNAIYQYLSAIPSAKPGKCSTPQDTGP